MGALQGQLPFSPALWAARGAGSAPPGSRGMASGLYSPYIWAPPYISPHLSHDNTPAQHWKANALSEVHLSSFTPGV